jgi:hypothetical protein
MGTDLGYSFEHMGKAIFLFGDSLGRSGGDVMGYTTATDPEKGVRLDFVTDDRGNYLPVKPPGVSMGGYEVPVSGISLDGRMYVVVKSNHSDDPNTPSDTSILTFFDEKRKTFRVLREISHLPAGRVIKMSMHTEPAPIANLPAGGPYILIWSSGVYRESAAYLSIVPRAQFETGVGTKYFAGLDSSSRPIWSDSEADAKPVVQHNGIGDLSVTWAAGPNMWLMTYDQPRQVMFRYSATPWGPWSSEQVIFDMTRDGGTGFAHQVTRQDGLSGPVISEDGINNPDGVAGASYAPYVIERFTRVDGDQMSIYYVLSTWNPYFVVLMKSVFALQ